MVDTLQLNGAQRLTAHVAAWDNGRTPEDGEPDRIVETEVFLEADGTQIVSDARIAEVRAWITANSKEQSNGNSR